jgi:D-glycero-D-manno-heptose 1,7-bisphosphate phosphatase
MQPKTQPRPQGVFLDRDGTLIELLPYLSDPDAVRLLPGTQQALGQLLGMGAKLFLFSNQSGVARGYYSQEQAWACHQRMLDLLGLGQGVFTQVCMAFEGPDEPPAYRKPSPRFIQESLQVHGLDPQHCYMVGDSDCDIEAALRAGIHPVYVASGHTPSAKVTQWLQDARVQAYPSLGHWVRGLQHCIRQS